DALDHARERADLDDEAGLLADLAGGALREGLAGFELAAGHRPLAGGGRLAALDEQHAAFSIEDDRADADGGRHARLAFFAAGLALGLGLAAPARAAAALALCARDGLGLAP